MPEPTTEETEDRMVERASVPNLAALLQTAISSGLITPSKGYAAA